MNSLVGYTRSPKSPRHIVQTQRAWYSGMTEQSLCGVKVNVVDHQVGTAAHATQPAGTCKRCAKVLDQTVREI